MTPKKPRLYFHRERAPCSNRVRVYGRLIQLRQGICEHRFCYGRWCDTTGLKLKPGQVLEARLVVLGVGSKTALLKREGLKK